MTRKKRGSCLIHLSRFNSHGLMQLWMQKPHSELDLHLVRRLCVESRKRMELQCFKENWNENADLSHCHREVNTSRMCEAAQRKQGSSVNSCQIWKDRKKSSQHSNRFLKANLFRDDFMLESKKEKSGPVNSKSMQTIINSSAKHANNQYVKQLLL